MLDTSEQTLVYRGCQLEVSEDGCRAADISKLPAEFYGVGIILSGNLCTCNSAFCNNARPAVEYMNRAIGLVLLAIFTVFAARRYA